MCEQNTVLSIILVWPLWFVAALISSSRVLDYRKYLREAQRLAAASSGLGDEDLRGKTQNEVKTNSEVLGFWSFLAVVFFLMAIISIAGNFQH